MQAYSPRQDSSDLSQLESIDYRWSMVHVQHIGTTFGFAAQLVMGFKLPFLGASYLLKNKKLLKYAATPSIVALVLFVGIFYGVYQLWIADLSWLWWTLAILANAIGSFFSLLNKY